MGSRLFRSALIALATLVATVGVATAKVTIAIGGAGCLCYLPTVLAEQLGEFKKAGVDVEMVNFKGGSQALTAVLGGSADVVSGYFDHCVNLAAKNQALQAFVVYDRFPGFALVVAPKNGATIKSVKDLAGKKVGVSAPGSSTDFFLSTCCPRPASIRTRSAWSGSASRRPRSPPWSRARSTPPSCSIRPSRCCRARTRI
jgi:NitT/TauT family transport system substrate-binding protein